MLQVIALMIAAYTMVRLFQVPWENLNPQSAVQQHRKDSSLALSSVLGMIIIGLLAWIAFSSGRDRAELSPRDAIYDQRIR